MDQSQHHHQQQHHHQSLPQHSQSLMMAPPHPPSSQQHPNSFNNNNNTTPNNNNNHSINPNSITATLLQQQQQQQHHQQQQNARFPSFNSDPVNSSPYGGGGSGGGGGDGSSPSSAAAAAGGFRVSGGSGFNLEPAKKKRGRPRKYSPSPDAGNNIALGLAPAPITPISTTTTSVALTAAHVVDSNDAPHNTPLSDNSAKKARGRPAGSGKKQLDALGSPGIGFTPHVITVKVGEDVASKIMAFSQQGPRTVCILSANGAICNVTLRQPAMSGGTVTYEGRFEIISLSGSFLLSESNGNRSRTGGLSVSLAGPDGRVLGGGVAGMLMAATPVQVIVGSFIADGKKPKSGSISAPPTNMLNFGAPVPETSPPSEGGSSESSDDESGSSPNNNRLSAPSSYNNNNNATQPAQNIPMYATNMGWANSTINMLPN